MVSSADTDLFTTAVFYQGAMNVKPRPTPLIAALLAVFSACVPPPLDDAPPTVQGSEDTKGIVGGQSTTITTHPWQISLQSSFGGHFCGGSVIDPGWVLTAAHCVEGSSASSLRVVAGITRLSQTGSAQVRSVSQIIRYPGYVTPESGRDAALLKLSSPLDLSGASVRAIPLVSQADEAGGLTDAGVSASVSGWGSLSSGGSSPDTLQAVTLPLVSQAQAQSAYSGTNITADQIGAGVLGVGGKDSCQGDSGGPLTVSDGGSGRKLAGIVSWGFGCADPRYPGLYARVAAFTGWIQGYVSPNLAPSVAFTSPSNGAQVSGLVSVAASASDSDGSVSRVTFTFPDGSSISDTSAPYSASWDSSQFADGPTLIRAQAFDNLGAASAVAQVSVTTNNGNQSCATGLSSASDTPLSIPDNDSAGIQSTISVSGSGTITDLQVSLQIQHTYRGDLVVQLVSPAGSTAVLSNRAGGSANDLLLSGVDVATFDGQAASGLWVLRVQDLAGQDVGQLSSWSVNIVAACGGGTPTGAWSGARSPNLATVDNGSACDSVTVAASGDASQAKLDLSGQHGWRSVLRGTLAHNGQVVQAFATGTFPRQGGSFSLTDRAVSGFTGDASGVWTLCVIDTDAYGDTGQLQTWSVHN